jgi:predicted nucleic acid-binding protein
VNRWIIHASVALKWCLSAQDEGLIPQAVELLDAYDRGAAEFLVPDLFWPELANAIRKAVGRQKIDAPWAEAAYAKVVDLHIPTMSSLDSVPEALQLALSHGATVYDSLYVVLALHARANLITADQRLANAMAARFPVKWLGAL